MMIFSEYSKLKISFFIFFFKPCSSKEQSLNAEWQTEFELRLFDPQVLNWALSGQEYIFVWSIWPK